MPSKHSIFLSPKASATLTQAAARKNPSLKKNSTDTPHADRRLAPHETEHIRDMLKLQASDSKGKGKSKAPTPAARGFGLYAIDENREERGAGDKSRNPFESMGNEHHRSVKQPSFLSDCDSRSDGEAPADATNRCGEHDIERSSAAPSETTTPSVEDIIDGFVDEEVQEVRLFLMNRQKASVMRRILKPKTKGRLNCWKIDSYRVLMAYSRSIEAFEAVGGVVQLNFLEQTSPLAATGATGGDPRTDEAPIRSGSHPKVQPEPEVDGRVRAIEQTEPAGGRWVKTLATFFIAMVTGGILICYILTSDDIIAVNASFWFLKQFIKLDRRIAVMLESAKGLLISARPLSEIANLYSAVRSFIGYAHTSTVCKIYRLFQAVLESALSHLEGLRDHTVAVAQGTPSYYQ